MTAVKITQLATETVFLASQLKVSLSLIKEWDKVFTRVCLPEKDNEEHHTIASIVRKQLGTALLSAIEDSVVELDCCSEELNILYSLLNRGTNSVDNLASLIDGTVRDAEAIISDGKKLISAFTSYTKGTRSLLERAKILGIA
jgi:hypothetical protein